MCEEGGHTCPSRTASVVVPHVIMAAEVLAVKQSDQGPYADSSASAAELVLAAAAAAEEAALGP